MHRLLTGPLSVSEVTIPIVDLPTRWQGCKLVQLSDFHYDGIRLSEALLAEAIATANAFDPDLVVLTGDFVTTEPEPIEGLVLGLKNLQSQGGVYAILGNHDLVRRRSRQAITQALTRVGIQVLWNQIAYPLDGQLPLVGLADYWSNEFDPAPVMSQLSPGSPRIVLSHNPDTAVELQNWRVDLQLSGHTHGGQIVIPHLGPIVAYFEKVTQHFPRWLRHWLPYLDASCHKVVKNWHWSEGLHQVGQNILYVNRGLGTYRPGRLFCPPEVTVLTLVPA